VGGRAGAPPPPPPPKNPENELKQMLRSGLG